MNKEKYKDQIAYYKNRVMLLVGLVVVLLVGELLMVWQWYQKGRKQVRLAGIRFNLKREEFDELWEDLTEKTVEVELEQEIRYGGDIGKLEPFE